MRECWIWRLLAAVCLVPPGCERPVRTAADRTLVPPDTHHPISLAWNPSTKTPPVGCTDGRLLVWEEPNLPPRVLETGSSFPVTTIALLPDGSLIAGTADGRLYAASLTGARERRFDPQGAAIRAIALHPQAERTLQFALALADGRLVFADAHGSQSVASHHKGGARCALYAPTGDTLVTAGDDGRLAWWSVSTLRRSAVADGHRTVVAAAHWLDNGRWLVSGDWDGHVLLWDSAAHVIMAEAEQSDAVADIAVRSATEFVTGSWDGRLRLWRVESAETGRPALRMAGQLETGHAIERIAISSDGRFVVSLGDQPAVQWWNLERLAETSSGVAVSTASLPDHIPGPTPCRRTAKVSYARAQLHRR